MDITRYIPSKILQIFQGLNNNNNNQQPVQGRQRESNNRNTRILSSSSCSLLRRRQRERQSIHMVHVERSATIGGIIYDKETYKNYIRWSLFNVDSVQSIINFIKAPHMTEELNDGNTVTEMKFVVRPDSVRELNSHEMWEVSGRCVNKSIVFLIYSKMRNSHIIYWKWKYNKHMMYLMPYDEKFSGKDALLSDILVDFLTTSLMIDHLGVDSSLHPQNEVAKIQLHMLVDIRGYNLMLYAAERGIMEIVKLLLNYGISTDLPNRRVNAQIVAYENQHFEVLLTFLKMNLTYPTKMVIRICSQEIKDFYNISNELHEAVIAGNIEKVEQISSKNSTIRHFYNLSNQSALKVAYDHKQIAVIDILVRYDKTFGPHEDTKKILESLTEGEMQSITTVYLKNSKDIPEQHMNILTANSAIILNHTEHSNKIQHAFKALNGNVLIKIILILIAATKKFRIVFDFGIESIQQVNVTKKKHFSPFTGRIPIAAAKLLDPLKEHEGLGSMARRLCQHAMNLTFQNSNKPYFESEQEGFTNFEKINEECKKKYGEEEVIDQVYDCYPEEMHHAELIVCVPQLLMLYQNQPEKLEQTQEKFKSLFEYYKQKVIPAMNTGVSGIRKRANVEVEPKEVKVGSGIKNSDILVILAVILVALIGAAGFLAFMPKNPKIRNNNFYKLSDSEQLKIRNAMVSYKNENFNFQDLLENDSTAFRKLSSNHIDLILNNEILNLSSPNFHYLSPYICLSWSKLTEILKQKFLASSCTFQNASMKFQDFYDLYPDAFEKLTSEQIREVLDGHSIIMGALPTPSIKFNHHRKFISEKSYLLYFKYLSDSQNVTFREYYEKFVDQNFFFFSDIYKEFEKTYPKQEDAVRAANDLIQFVNGEYYVHYGMNNLIDKSMETRLIVLASDESSENTVTFEQFLKTIKQNFPTRWVIFADIKKYANAYINKEINILTLWDKIFNETTSKIFGKKILDDSFMTNNIIFMWNDLKAVDISFDRAMLDILKFIHKKSKNVQLVSTTPAYSVNFRNSLGAEVHRLIPLLENNQNEELRILLMSKQMKKNKNN